MFASSRYLLTVLRIKMMELFASRVYFTSPNVMILYIIDIPTVTVMAKKEMKSL